MKLKYTVATGSSFVATLGDNTVTATAVDGKAVLDCKEVGTWHIKATSPDGVVKEWDTFVPYGGLVKEWTAEKPQLVNYILIYDGTLGEAGADGANMMKSNKFGGMTAPRVLYSNLPSSGGQGIADVTYNTDNLLAGLHGQGSVSGGDKKWGVYCATNTTNAVDLTEYNQIFSKMSGSLRGYGGSGYNMESAKVCLIEATSPTFTYGGCTILDTYASVANNTSTFPLAFRVKDISDKTGALSIGFYYEQTNYITLSPGSSNTLFNLYAFGLTKADEWQELSELCELTADSITELLIESAVILNNETAVKYMVRRCTGDFMLAAVQSSTFLAALSESPYSAIIYANEHWAKFLAMVA